MSKDWYTLSPAGLLVRGVLGIAFGVVVMVWPTTSGLAFVMLWGFWVLVDSLGSFGQTLRSDTTGRTWLGLLGLLGLVTAFLAIVTPAMTAVAARFTRPALHAWTIVFVHPVRGDELRIRAPLPHDLTELLARLELSVPAQPKIDE